MRTLLTPPKPPWSEEIVATECDAGGGEEPVRVTFVDRRSGDRGGMEKWKKQERSGADATRLFRKGKPQLESMNCKTDAGSSDVEQIVPAGVQGERTSSGTRNPSGPVEVVGGAMGSQNPPFSS